MLKIELDFEDSIENALEGLDRTDKAVKRASDRAVRKVLAWARREIQTAVAKDADIPGRAVKFRLRHRFDNKTKSGLIWMGLNPISAHHAGKPRQSKAGVSVRKHRFPGAFVADVNGPKVFIREGDERLPIRLETIDIETAGELAARRMEPRVNRRLMALMEQELNYAMNIESR